MQSAGKKDCTSKYTAYPEADTSKLLFLVPAEGISRQISPFAKIHENDVRRSSYDRRSPHSSPFWIQLCRIVAARKELAG